MGQTLGITGGIATGKSSVVKIFQELGFPVVDADIIARKVVEPGTLGLKAIIETFGHEMLNEDGTLNRKKLGTVIFSDSDKRNRLNQLLSAFIKTEIVSQINEKKIEADLVIVDIPLLYEGGYESILDRVAVVYVTENVQLERLMLRDSLSEKEAKQRITSQWSIEKKKEKADIVFDNQGTLENTKKQVIFWLEKKE